MGDQVIRIQGGLPALPGTNITMVISVDLIWGAESQI